MDRRAWLGAVAGIVGLLAGVAAVVGGQPVSGALAAVGAGVAGATVVLEAQRNAALLRFADEAERDHEETELRLQAAAAELTDAHERTGRAVSVVDPESTLLDHRVFGVTFDRKIAAASRHLRPLSLVVVDLASALPTDPPARRAALATWGSVVTSTLRESDIPCRLSDTSFGIILEDTPESGGVWVAERLQIAASCNGLNRLSAAVATYPTHGLRSEKVLAEAQSALMRSIHNTLDSDRFGRVEVPSPEI